MTPKIKIDLKALLASGNPIHLELGCGGSKGAGRIGIDRLDLPGVDIIADVEAGLYFLPDNSVDEIHSRSFFEHIADLEALMREVVRVLKPTGTCHVFVPHFSNPYFYSDYTHNKFMGLYTFYYFVKENHQMKRKVPNYCTDIWVRVVSQRLIIPNPGKRYSYFKRILGKVFNSNSSMQELYEEHFCYIFPCYGLEIVFTPDSKGSF